MQFAVVDGENEMGTERYEDLEAAVAAATKTAEEDPGSSLDVVQLLKTVTSSVQVEVEDVK